MKRLIPALLAIAMLQACRSGSTEKEATVIKPADGQVDTSAVSVVHPDWANQGNVYEVNIRQYTKEGTFKAFATHMDRLKDMAITTLWFMPINPISKKEHKGELGSYYAVSDYTAINPEYGTLDDFKDVVKTAHQKGFKVLIDWVPNHTGADHGWLTRHKEYYELDSVTKEPIYTADWNDTRELNYRNMEMRDSMIAAMKYWIKETDIDGYRVDVAWGVPDDFWKQCLPQLRAMKQGLFFLAEADGPQYHLDGFDATYPWNMFHKMVDVAQGRNNALAIDSILHLTDSTYTANAMRLYFTSNHDENSWNKADFGTMPGPIHAPFAVLTQTLPRAIPLVYSGQEEPVLDSIRFFYKDPITFRKLGRAKFYKTLLNLRHGNPALSADASFRKLSIGDDKAVYAFTREKEGKKVLVIVNLSGKEQEVSVKDASFHGKPYNVFAYTNEPLTANPWKIEPWGYVIYTY